MENRTYTKAKPPKGWLWTDGAADYLGVFFTTLYRWRRDNYGPKAVQHGRRRYRYKISELDKFLAYGSAAEEDKSAA